MKAKVRLAGQAKEEYERLERLAKEEQEKGTTSSENQTHRTGYSGAGKGRELALPLKRSGTFRD